MTGNRWNAFGRLLGREVWALLKRVALRRWERIKVWGRRVDDAAEWLWNAGKRAIGYGLLWSMAVNSQVFPIWFTGVVLPPLLAALVLLGGHRAAKTLRYTYVMDRHAHALVGIAASTGISGLVGIGLLLDRSVFTGLADTVSWSGLLALTAIIVMLWTLATAAWGMFAGVCWMVLPRSWVWARELMARLATATTVFSPLLFITFALLAFTVKGSTATL